MGRFSEHTTGSRIWCMSRYANLDTNVDTKITTGESILLTFEASQNDSRLRSLT